MTTVTFEEYLEEKNAFCEKQGAEFGDPTAHIRKTKRNCYRLEFTWGSEIKWIEATEKIYERTTINLHDVECPIFAQLWRTEYWNTEDGQHKYCYWPA